MRFKRHGCVVGRQQQRGERAASGARRVGLAGEGAFGRPFGVSLQPVAGPRERRNRQAAETRTVLRTRAGAVDGQARGRPNDAVRQLDLVDHQRVELYANIRRAVVLGFFGRVRAALNIDVVHVHGGDLEIAGEQLEGRPGDLRILGASQTPSSSTSAMSASVAAFSGSPLRPDMRMTPSGPILRPSICETMKARPPSLVIQ